MDEAPKIEQPMTTPLAGGDDVEKGKGMAWLSYIGILWLVPMLAMKENVFCKFHVKQGIMLMLYGVAVGIVGGAIPFLGWFIVAPIGSIIVLVLAIMGIINSLGGKYWVCPLGVGVLAAKWFKF
jgi:uncharacterized membrane protein